MAVDRSYSEPFEIWDLPKRNYESNDVIFEEGSPGDAMFLIESGRIKISQKVAEGENILAVLGKGDFFGEMALLDDGPRSASAIALEETILLEIGRDTFTELLMGGSNVAPRMLVNTAKVVSERLRTTDSILLTLYERALEVRARLEELQSDLKSMISHELRTPLSTDIHQEPGLDENAA